MATALATGISAAHPNLFSISVFDPQAGAINQFSDEVSPHANVTAADSNQQLMDQSDVVFIAVKPQIIRAALESITVPKNCLIVSVVAGVDLVTLQRLLETDRIVRVMPNTPSLIGMGASGFACAAGVTEEERNRIHQYLESLGVAIQVRPDQLDAVTGLSGSGPAYVFQFVQALIDGGVLAGLHRDDARKLALQTVLGATKLILETDQHPAVLIDQVTSPGGTTIHGIKALEETGFRDAVMSAVVAATHRAEELGG